jgi:transcriptional regulator with XRE-family HTH domain
MATKLDFRLAPPAVVLKELGERLAQTRLQQNVTQDELASRSGVGVRTLRRFESGNGATLDNFIRLLQALGHAHLLDQVLPLPGVSPMREVMMAKKTLHKRATRPRALKKTAHVKTPWSWDNKETPQ